MGGARDPSADADGLKIAPPSIEPARFQAVVVCPDTTGNSLREVGGITLLERLLRQLSEMATVESILVIKPPQPSLPPPSTRVRKELALRDAAGNNAWEMLRDARAHLR